ncbi:MAG TPA: (2Fe-2S)-binding protein [Chloroflexota bacterium]|jgi:nicotinate dehydrogenase subunit A
MPDTLQLMVNGQAHELAVDPETPLLYVLRNDLGLNGPRFGCGLSQCGACTVHLDGRPVRSCVTPAARAVGAAVVTLEGLGTADQPHPLQAAFLREQAGQCAYCINGMIMVAAAFLATTPNPSEDDIKGALDRNLCRCGSHLRIVRAVKAAAEAMP